MPLPGRLVTAALLALATACGNKSADGPAPGVATEGAEAPLRVDATPATPEPRFAPPPPPPPPTHSEATLAAPAEPPAPRTPSFAGVVIHEVKDFDVWRVAFEARIDARRQAGIVAEAVMRGTDNDKLVVVYLPATDAERLKALFESRELAEAMKASGVQGKPTLLIVQHDGGEMAPPERTGLYGAIARFKVKDYAAFKAVLESEPQQVARASAGILGYGISRQLGSESDAPVYLQGDDLDKLKGYLDAKETKQAMKEAGVRGQPEVTFAQEGSMTLYE
jgi:hypothetical protein